MSKISRSFASFVRSGDDKTSPKVMEEIFYATDTTKVFDEHSEYRKNGQPQRLSETLKYISKASGDLSELPSEIQEYIEDAKGKDQVNLVRAINFLYNEKNDNIFVSAKDVTLQKNKSGTLTSIIVTTDKFNFQPTHSLDSNRKTGLKAGQAITIITPDDIVLNYSEATPITLVIQGDIMSDGVYNNRHEYSIKTPFPNQEYDTFSNEYKELTYSFVGSDRIFKSGTPMNFICTNIEKPSNSSPVTEEVTLLDFETFLSEYSFFANQNRNSVDLCCIGYPNELLTKSKRLVPAINEVLTLDFPVFEITNIEQNGHLVLKDIGSKSFHCSTGNQIILISENAISSKLPQAEDYWIAFNDICPNQKSSDKKFYITDGLEMISEAIPENDYWISAEAPTFFTFKGDSKKGEFILNNFKSIYSGLSGKTAFNMNGVDLNLIGNPESLTTDNTSSLVAAINEIKKEVKNFQSTSGVPSVIWELFFTIYGGLAAKGVYERYDKGPEGEIGEASIELKYGHHTVQQFFDSFKTLKTGQGVFVTVDLDIINPLGYDNGYVNFTSIEQHGVAVEVLEPTGWLFLKKVYEDEAVLDSVDETNLIDLLTKQNLSGILDTKNTSSIVGAINELNSAIENIDIDAYLLASNPVATGSLVMNKQNPKQKIGDYSTLTGYQNEAQGSYTAALGGRLNVVNSTSTASSIVGGTQNLINNTTNSGVFAGSNNKIQIDSLSSSIVGGFGNTVSAATGVIVGGSNNVINRSFGGIILGGDNLVNNSNGSIITGFYNKDIADQNSLSYLGGNQAKNALVIGNGKEGDGQDKSTDVRSNAFRVQYDGAVYGAAAYNSTGADIAEYYEWLDGNPNNEDRRGLFVTLEGRYIRLATSEDTYIKGVISAIPAVIGNSYDDTWQGMYQKDIFGEIITDEDGRALINPDYDPTKKYQPRSKRYEFGLVSDWGQLVLVDDGTCVENGFAKCGDGGKATAANEPTRIRVMERLDENHILVAIGKIM